MAIRVKSIKHVLVPTDDLAATTRFYGELLGLDEVSLPATGYAFKMAWFGQGDHEIHVVQKDPNLTSVTEADFNPTLQPHIAFEVEDVDEAARVLDAEGFSVYETRGEGVLSRSQIFVRDPSGMVVELYRRRDREA